MLYGADDTPLPASTRQRPNRGRRRGLRMPPAKNATMRGGRSLTPVARRDHQRPNTEPLAAASHGCTPTRPRMLGSRHRPRTAAHRPRTTAPPGHPLAHTVSHGMTCVSRNFPVVDRPACGQTQARMWFANHSMWPELGIVAATGQGHICRWSARPRWLPTRSTFRQIPDRAPCRVDGGGDAFERRAAGAIAGRSRVGYAGAGFIGGCRFVRGR